MSKEEKELYEVEINKLEEVNQNLELELDRIRNSKPYMIGMKIKKLAFSRFVSKLMYDRNKITMIGKSVNKIFGVKKIVNVSAYSKGIKELKMPRLKKALILPNAYKNEVVSTLSKLEYKAIFIIPEHDNNIKDRVKHIVDFVTNLNILCIMCDKSISSSIQKINDNFYKIKQEEELISFVKYKSAIVFINNCKQIEFFMECKNKVLWVDIEDVEDYEFFENITKTQPTILTTSQESKSFKATNIIEYKVKEDLDKILNIVYKSPDIWKIFANHNNQNTICVKTTTFLDFNGENYFCGGAERYLLDLYEVCKELGFRMCIYQAGHYNWLRYYNDIEVISVHDGYYNHTLQCKTKATEDFNTRTDCTSVLNIYSAFFEAWPCSYTKSIGISHGVAWDSKNVKNYTASSFWNSNKVVIESAKIVDKMVSVDTNTANWFQTIDFELGNSMEFIPNYVNTKEFYQVDKKNNDKIIITYPRRIYEPRGLYIVLEIIDDILAKYSNIEFWFVGKGEYIDIKSVKTKQNKWRDKIKLFYRNPEEMHTVYKETDITLIPTIYSEGTSLSCLEAMASGNGIIASRIGGLTDLIINEYNGLLVEPNAVSLKEALISLIEDKCKLEKLKKNAKDTAQVFTKDKWKEDWKRIISEFTSHNRPYSYSSKNCEIYVKDIFDIQYPLSQKILGLLQDNYVVFLRCYNKTDKKLYSFDRLQIVDFNEELYSVPDLVITEKNLKNKNIVKKDCYVMYI